MKRHRRKARARSKRTAHRQLQKLKDGVATAVKQLGEVQGEVDEIDSCMFVCIEALRAQGADAIGPHVAMVLETAYDKLVLSVNQNVRDALQALDQGGGK